MCTVRKFVDEFNRHGSVLLDNTLSVPKIDTFEANAVKRNGSWVIPVMIVREGEAMFVGSMHDWPKEISLDLWTRVMQAVHYTVLMFNHEDGRECALVRMQVPESRAYAFAVEIFDRKTGPDGVKGGEHAF